jgi:gluconate 2-dehydrogenase subunit 3-like protein
MAGQGLERREVLRILALAAGASGFPGFVRWTFACGHGSAALLQIRPAAYTPRFFTAPEYATVERLAEIIVPSDDTPGAREAGVAEFIDFMVSSDPGVQYRFRYGLTWLDAHAGKLHGRRFVELDAPTQAALLEPLAYRDRERAGEEEGRAFFKLMREHTLMGFYTSKIGLQQLDYPGLKTYYPALPGCPHPGDPEHLHLPAPKA